MSPSNALVLVLGLACAVVACSGADDSTRDAIPTPDGGVAPDGNGTDAGPVPPPPPLCLGKGRTYLGFAGEKRQDARAGSDRVRVKPYRVTNPTPNFGYTMKVDALLAKDMQRVLGVEVGAVDGTSVVSALGTLPDRRYVEPRAGAVPIARDRRRGGAGMHDDADALLEPCARAGGDRRLRVGRRRRLERRRIGNDGRERARPLDRRMCSGPLRRRLRDLPSCEGEHP